MGTPMAPKHVTDFVRQLTPMAVEIGDRYGIDPALIITQAAIESGWGQEVSGNNYFGVKSHGRPGGQTITTHEEIDGKRVKVQDSFRVYDDLAGSMEDYAKFLSENPRYGDVFKSRDLGRQVEAIASSGYATDSTYPGLLRDVSSMVKREMVPVPPGEIPNVVASRLDTQRPDIVGTSQWPTSEASRQVPTRSETPRISPEMDGVFAYTPPGMERAHIAAGMGSLTPDFFRREVPLPQARPERVQTASVTMPTPLPDFSPSTTPRRLPPIAPPPPLGADRVISASMERAGAARDPALAAALAARSSQPSIIDTSMQRTAAAVDPALQRALEARNAPGVGMPPATRSVASVPIPAPPSRPTGPALSRDSVAQSQRGDYMALAWPNIQVPSQSPPMPATAMASTIPGPPSAFKTADALPGGVFPQVATALDVLPPPTAFPNFPVSYPQRANVAMPTPMGARPALPSLSLASLAMPTPIERRPNPNALKITVDGGTYSRPAPPTFQGSRTGQTYTAGQRLMLGDDAVRANADGSFTNERTGKKVASGTGWQALHGLS